MKHFVYTCKHIYSNTFSVYNVHNLLHLHADCLIHECAFNKISCFPYENFRQKLKPSVRNSVNHIAQVFNRHFEYKQCFNDNTKENMFIKISSNVKDGCFLLTDFTVAFIRDKVNYEEYECDTVKRRYLDDVYEIPIPFTQLNISLIQKKNYNKVIQRRINKVKQRGFAIFPLLRELER